MKPRLIATLGPASLELSAEMVQAGASGLRLNGSHLTPDALLQAVLTVRARVPEVPLTIDLQGSKMRLGAFKARELRSGEKLILSQDLNAPDTLPLPHPELFVHVRPGDTFSVGDGQMRLRVIDASPKHLEVSALESGTLFPRKGLTLLDRPIDLGGLTQADLEQLTVVPQPLDASWAISYLEDGREVDALRRCLPGAHIIGKIERAAAIDNLDTIARKVDALWICRGDLGEQLGLQNMSSFVAHFDPQRYAIPSLMAGQVFEHLTEHGAPTRSEICHLYDLLQRGYTGIVLSDETAIGKRPVQSVSIVRELLDRFSEGKAKQ